MSIERLGIEVAEQYLRNAAIVLVCGDDAAVDHPRDRTHTAAHEQYATRRSERKVILAARLRRWSSHEKLDYVRVSAQTGEGLAKLVQSIVDAPG